MDIVASKYPETLEIRAFRREGEKDTHG